MTNLAPALRDALIKLGHQPAKRLTKFRVYDVLENDAILKVNPYNKGADWHWVAWDAERTRILDPWRPRPYVKHYRPVGVLTTKRRSADVIGNAVHVMRIAKGGR
ncbi:MAG: hypothetical protein WA231_24860 [Methylocella sp.]